MQIEILIFSKLFFKNFVFLHNPFRENKIGLKKKSNFFQKNKSEFPLLLVPLLDNKNFLTIKILKINLL